MTRYQDDFYDAVNGEWEKQLLFQMINLVQVVFRFG